MLWKRRGTSPQAIDGAAARELAPALQPIHVFLVDRVVRGEFDAGDERVSDLLSAGAPLRLRRDDGEWESFLAHDIVAVAPPPFESQRRIHRAKRRVQFTAPPYTIVGTAHLSPGTQLDPFVLRTGRRALPVTGAWVRTADGEVDEDLTVAIVNVEAIESATELIDRR